MSILKNFISDKTNILKVSLAVGGLAIVAAASILATTAYLSATTNQKENAFSPYTLTDTQISEPNGTEYSLVEDDTNHYVTKKVVEVQNPAGENKKPVFVRVLATVEGQKDGEYDTFTTTKVWDTNLNTDYWVQVGDYYYYKYVLYPGYQTQPLFTDGKIYLSTGENVTLTFTTDTVQAWANGARDVIDTSFVTSAWGGLPSDVQTNNTSKKNVRIGSETETRDLVQEGLD